MPRDAAEDHFAAGQLRAMREPLDLASNPRIGSPCNGHRTQEERGQVSVHAGALWEGHFPLWVFPPASGSGSQGGAPLPTIHGPSSARIRIAFLSVSDTSFTLSSRLRWTTSGRAIISGDVPGVQHESEPPRREPIAAVGRQRPDRITMTVTGYLPGDVRRARDPPTWWSFRVASSRRVIAVTLTRC